MFFGVAGNFLENGFGGELRLPAPDALGEGAIEHDPGEVEGAFGRMGGDGMASPPYFAPLGELAKGAGRGWTTGDIQQGWSFGGGGCLELLGEQAPQIIRMKAIPHLMALTAEPEIAQGGAGFPGVEPEGENPLIGAAELARSGQNPAAIDPNGQGKAVAVFESQCFRGDFGGPIEGDWGAGGKGFINPPGAYPGGQIRIRGEGERALMDHNRQMGEGFDGVNPTRTEKDKTRSATPGIFEEIYGAEQVMFDQLAGTGSSVHPGEHTWLGRRVDNPINLGEAFQIGGEAKITVEKADSASLQGAGLRGASRANEIVQATDFGR